MAKKRTPEGTSDELVVVMIDSTAYVVADRYHKSASATEAHARVTIPFEGLPVEENPAAVKAWEAAKAAARILNS